MKKTNRLTRKHLCELSLRPYPGVVFVTNNRKAFKRAAKELFDKDECLDGKAGRFLQEPTWYHRHTALVWFSSPHTLAHELAHVVFGIFDSVGIQSTCGNEESFCYMLSQLMLEATSEIEVDTD